MTRPLPKGIKLSVASASFQIEGAWNAADKCPSIWDNFCHRPGVIQDGSTADDACKSYEFYQRDVAMIKWLGVDSYRFSISWCRILPNGFANKISKEGSDYYNKLIDELIANGIEPVVTMYHWDLPQNLQDLGGWTNPLIADWFEDYARVLFDLYGDRVKTWITINEPKQIGILGYGMPIFAPAINAHGVGEYLAAKYMLMAHAKAWHLYDKEYRETQKGVIGITIATDWRQGMTDSPSDVQAGQDAMDFEVGLYGHPIFSSKGGFPDSVVRLVGERSQVQGYPRSRLPEFTEQEKEFVKGKKTDTLPGPQGILCWNINPGTSDFYGFNHYSTRFYTRDSFSRGSFPEPSYQDDIGASFSLLDYKPGVMPHCTEIPFGIRKALKWVKDQYNNPPIMILENGFGNMGGLEDDDRISYLKKYLHSILDAVEKDGCNVIVYTVWSLMDNFEWSSGLQIKFGIFETDYEDEQKTRTAKASAFWYRHLVATRAFDPNYKPTFEKLTF